MAKKKQEEDCEHLVAIKPFENEPILYGSAIIKPNSDAIVPSISRPSKKDPKKKK